MARERVRLSLTALLLALAAPALAADVTFELDTGTGFVIENDGASVEHLRIDEATGNISRNGALFVHTTGADNTFVGEDAGNTATSGIGLNSAFGHDALTSVTTGSLNNAFGAGALRLNTIGRQNSAFGNDALSSNTSGGYNSAFGDHALTNNTASGSSGFGDNALFANTTGSSNSPFRGAGPPKQHHGWIQLRLREGRAPNQQRQQQLRLRRGCPQGVDWLI
jgi:hypothetical protein